MMMKRLLSLLLVLASALTWGETTPAEMRAKFLVAPRAERRKMMEDAAVRRLMATDNPREVAGVENFRDLGGKVGLGGRKVKKGLVYRSAKFENVTPEGRAYVVGKLGVKTDLDLRTAETTAHLNGKSPLGDGVTWVLSEFQAYKKLGTPEGIAAFKVAFKPFLDKANYPIAFHCKSGKDRTGTLAYVLYALLGVDEETILLDWEASVFDVPEVERLTHPGRYDRLADYFRTVPGRTLQDKAESFVKAAGFTDADIAFLRERLLEPLGSVTLPVTRNLSCDVLVVGGGPAGFPAAVCAARHGAKVLLAEKNGYLGGMATAGLVGPFMTATTPKGEVQLIRGFFDEFVRGMAARGGAIHPMEAKIGSFSSYRSRGHYGMTTFDPECFKKLAEEMCRTSGVELLYHAMFIAAAKEGNRVTGAYFATKAGIWKVEAKIVVDATGDGDVSAAAGVPTVFGDGAGDVQASSLFFRIRGVDKAKMDAHDAECLKRGDRKAEFYVNEILAARKAGEFPIWRQKVEVYEGLDGTWIVNMGQSDGVDGRDPRKVTAAEIGGREQAEIIVRFLRKYVKGCENCELVRTAAELGVRESRRIVGEYTLTLADVQKSVRFPDSVFCCANHIDIHRKGRVEYVTRDTDDPYYFPYRSLVPQGVDGLLVAGRCAAAERPVMAAIRVMPPCFAMGQAAGTAAALAVKEGREPRELDGAALSKVLVKDGVYLPEEERK